MSKIKCFFLESTDRAEVTLRRYVSSTEKCPNYWLHNAEVKIDEIDWISKYEGCGSYAGGSLTGYHPINADDPRWPKKCDHCDRLFTDKDEFQPNIHRLYRRMDTDELVTLSNAPAGAMWFRDSMIENWGPDKAGSDGHVLIVKTPGGEWNVDSIANNCDSICATCSQPYPAHHKQGSICNNFKDARPHKCWIREGDPKTGIVTVSKNGITCGTGAGSILCGKYHGFLRNGYLEEC